MKLALQHVKIRDLMTGKKDIQLSLRGVISHQEAQEIIEIFRRRRMTDRIEIEINELGMETINIPLKEET